MTELKIQPKKRGGMWWLWLIPLALLALWLLTRGRKDDDTTTTTTADTTVTTTATTTTAVGTGPGATIGAAGATATANAGGDYASFIGAPATDRDEAAQHQYTADGIRRLAAAIEGSSAGASASTQVATMRAMADSLNMSPAGSDRHADMARRAFDAAVVPLKTLAGANAASLEAAAKAVNPSRHLLQQKAEIQKFFELSRDALGAQAGPTSATPGTTSTP